MTESEADKADIENRTVKPVRPTASLPNCQLEFGRHAMACQFQVLFNLQHPANGPELAIRALDKISDLEQILSVYIATSELSKLNRESSSGPIHVSELVGNLIELALQFHRITSGAFDITSASLSQAWGFSRRNGRMPTSEEIANALALCGSQWLEYNSESRTLSFQRPNFQLNPGGIGKGYALDQAAHLLDQGCVSDYLMHGGLSSALARGDQHGAEFPGWRIAVRHPYRTEELLGEIRLCNQAIGTSGAANQYFYYQGKRYGHILDPRTGWPAQHWLSVTVVADCGAAADAIATAAFVLSPEELDAFARREPQFGIVAFREGVRSGDTEVLTWNLSPSTWVPFDRPIGANR